jgi:COP9 signalosome complex subunit 3
LDPSGSVLTGRHQLLVELALESGDYGSALPVLEKYVLYFPGSAKQLPYKFRCDLTLSPAVYMTAELNMTKKFKHVDVLEYFYYASMIYIGLRRWEDALEYLESAITYPSKDNSISKITLEAYKKWILVGILAQGKVITAPKTVNNTIQKAFHTLAKPYDTVANIFESGTAQRLKAEVEAGQKIWQDDRNTGLMYTVLAAYQKTQIRNLAEVYSTISIPEIQGLTTSAEVGTKVTSQVVENLVQSMITSGELHASLSHPTNGPPVLTFSSTGPVLSESEMQRELRASKERIEFLTNEIKQTGRSLTQDKEYIKWAQKQKKNGKNADQAISGPDMEEEVLMEGIDFH